MDLRKVIQDEKAVSPVIGVILMVAITVILAAVIGAFVLGIGQGQTQTPQATFQFDYTESSGDLELNHEGGDTFSEDNTGNLTVQLGSSSADWLSTESDSEVSAGDSFDVDSQLGVNITSGDEVEVVWVAPDGSQSSVVTSYTVR